MSDPDYTPTVAEVAALVPSRPMRLLGAQWIVTAAAGSNDAVDVGILDANLNWLASSGSTPGKLNGLGKKSAQFTAYQFVLPRTVYYAAFVCGAIGTTPADVMCPSYSSLGEQLVNSVVPDVDCSFQAATFPIPNGSATTATGVNALNSAVVNVASTVGFSTMGVFLTGGVLTTYTGVTGTSFTGCGNHAATTGGEVIAPSITTNGAGAHCPFLFLIEAP